LQYDQERLELMRVLNSLLVFTGLVLLVGSTAAAQGTERDEQKRLVLVELFTSQG
jgi:hypothetical protein